MRTTIDIDEELLNKAMVLSKSSTKAKAVHLALDIFVKYLRKRKALALYGKVEWQGNLRDMRS